MTTPLEVSQEDPINLDGSLDGSSDLQLLHRTDSLADYGQTLHGEHDDLDDPAGVVQVRVLDFSDSGTTWTISVEHDPGSGSVTWSRGTDHAYYDFGPMSAEQTLEITATDGASPPTTKTRSIHIKVTPPDAQPDRPRG